MIVILPSFCADARAISQVFPSFVKQSSGGVVKTSALARLKEKRAALRDRDQNGGSA